MKQLKNFLIKREQSQACLSFAKREKSRLLAKTLLTLALLLTAVTGAWAADGIECSASDIGKVICTDGSIYAKVSDVPTGKTAAAMIAYIDMENKNGLALALSNEGSMKWSDAITACEGKSAVAGGTWVLPSKEQWEAMGAVNSTSASAKALRDGFNSVGGTNMESGAYWSSTANDDNANKAYRYNFTNGYNWDGSVYKTVENYVRACLTFNILVAPATYPFPITWDATNKTTGFNLPAGNVTVSVEYYPQAAFATGGAPTAINDVPATTDGAIVKEGTVAKIGSTENAQGTLMYYAVQSETAPEAPDYDNKGWSADVPTAAAFNQGNVYVWYYVKGADGDETSTFNDGAITKLGESGYVTLAAAPTYAITLKEDTEESDKWDISPAEATKGTTITATYSGSRKVKSVKAVKKAVAEGHALTSAKLGEIVCSDGKAYAAADKDNLPEGVKAEALVCYVNGEHGLALAMADVKNEKMSWDNDRGANDGKTAAEWCDGWNTSHPITGATWLLASKTQWDNMINAAGGASNLSSAFSAVGGTNLQAFSYWSSTPNIGVSAWRYYFPSSSWSWTYLNKDNTGSYIRACLQW